MLPPGASPARTLSSRYLHPFPVPKRAIFIPAWNHGYTCGHAGLLEARARPRDRGRQARRTEPVTLRGADP